MALKTIYIAEDEISIRKACEWILHDYNVHFFPDAEGLLEALKKTPPDLVLTDYDMGNGLTGDGLIAKIQNEGYRGAVLMVSGTIPQNVSYRALRKPIEVSILRSTIQEILQ